MTELFKHILGIYKVEARYIKLDDNNNTRRQESFACDGLASEKLITSPSVVSII